MRRRLLYACFAASGAAGLVLEIVWSKYLSLLSGNAFHGVATVVAAFLGGLGLGAWIGGRFAERVREPLLWYARLEAAVGVLALASPLAFLAAKPLIAGLHGATGGSGPLFLTVRFALFFIALLPPTVAMGASLPLMTSDFARRGAGFGASVARLYAWNTAGAVFGVVAAGFALIPLVGLWKTAVIAGLLDLAVAFVVIRWRPAAPPATVPTETESRKPGTAARRSARAVTAAQFARFVVPAAAVSGFTAILYEVAWTRVLSIPLGGMVYSFAAILALYLLGIALGAGLASRLLARSAPPVVLFGLLQVLLAAIVVLGAHLFGWIPAAMASLVVDASAHPVRLVAGELGIVAVVVLPASILLGALFPVSAAILQRRQDAPGASVGAVYAANTVGSIAGSLLTGFVLIPWLGSLTTILFAALVNLALGLAALATSELRRGVRVGMVALGGTAALVLALTALPTWPVHRMTIGLSRLLREAKREGTARDGASVIATLDAETLSKRLAFYREGRTASVAVLESGGDAVLVVNGKPDASTGARGDMMSQVMIGQLPLLFAPAAADVCIVGYGSGVTTHAVLTHPVRSVLTVEIEQAVIDAAPHFRGGAFEPLADPRSQLLVEDAGTFLRSTRRSFDVIVNEPSNPWLAGVGDLFTSEFYDEVASRLSADGVFTQWVQCYETSPATQAVILRTLARRFPHGHVFFFPASSDMVVVARPDRELVLDPATMQAAFDRADAKRDMARVGIASLADAMRFYVGRLERLAARAGEGPVNTDDNGWLEHRAPLDIVGAQGQVEFGTADEIADDLARSLEHDREGAGRLLAAGVERAVEQADEKPAAGFVGALERLGRPEATAARRRLADIGPRLARIKEADALCRQALDLLGRSGGDRNACARAADMLRRAEEIDPAFGQITWRHGSALLVCRRPAEAIPVLRRALEQIPATATFGVHNDLAGAYFLTGDHAACLREAEELDALKPGAPEAATWRVRVAFAKGDREGARRELARGLRATPGSRELDALAQELGL